MCIDILLFFIPCGDVALMLRLCHLFCFGSIAPCVAQGLKAKVDSLLAAGKLLVVDHELIKV